MDKTKENQNKQEIYLKKAYVLVDIIRRELHKEQQMPLPEDVTCDQLMKIAKKHSVDNIVYQGLEKIDGCKAILQEKWKQQHFQCTMQGKVQMAERDRLYQAFTDAGIRYLPLKGCILKELYEKPELRQMSDLDILIDDDNRERAKEIMVDLGYETSHFGSHHDCYEKKPWMAVELHHKMLDTSLENTSKYECVWEWAYEEPVGSYRYHFNWDDFYMFFVEHFAKHYYINGCGIRFLMDMYVFLEKKGNSLNQKYLKKKLKKHKLLRFKNDAEQLAYAWFDQGVHHVNEEMEAVILNSGIYGTAERKKRKDINKFIKKFHSKKIGKVAYFLSKVFLKYDKMRQIYPVLEKVPILLPVFWICRFVHVLASKRHRIGEVWSFINKE